jgi:hypothetical protein
MKKKTAPYEEIKRLIYDTAEHLEKELPDIPLE